VTTKLVNDRDTALKVGFLATDWTHPIPYDIYEKSMSGWDIKAVMRDNECIGAVYFKDSEVHASILPDWRKKWATKGILKEMFAQDTVTTRVTPGHEYMYGILSRLGFTQQNDGYFVKGH